jgi:CheY-like chemotaxis protein
VDLAALVRSAVETSEPLIAAAKHRLDVSLPAEPIPLDGDAVRLAQVIANILNNAAKYTEPGGRIEVSARRDAGMAVIAVKDNGTGMSAGALGDVFEMFSRGDRTHRGEESGLGIGLAIARRLVEMHGGTVEARSEGLGRGSEFIVRLPLAAADAAEPKVVSREEALEPIGSILVVDDNRDAADTLRMLLEALGAEVRIARDGREALELFRACDPAVVLMDIGMPGMDGYEVARLMRAQFPDRQPIMIAVTGWGQEEDRRRAHAAGFDHHLVKPAHIATIRSLLEAHPQRVS